MRMEDELLADARREAEHARAELIKARSLLAEISGVLAARVRTGNELEIEARLERETSAFLAETTLYPKAEAVGD